MQTAIGRAFRSREKLALSSAIAVAAVGVDIVLSLDGRSYGTRGIVPLVAISLYLGLARGDPVTLGLLTRPRQGFGYWIRITALVGAGMAVLLVIAFGAWYLISGPPPIYRTSPADVPGRLLYACVAAPLVEEATYRLVVCVPLARLAGPWVSILTSGALFAALHVAYGNPSPENLFGGFVLAWAFVKSGSLVVPLVWHSLGNLVVLAGQVAAWYLA